MKTAFRIVVILLIGSWVIISLLNRKEYKEIIVQNAKRDLIATPVTIFKAQKQPLSRTIQLSGKVESSVEIFVISTVSGEIKSLNVSPGDFVKKGQIIAVVDDYYFRQQYDIAKQAYEQDLRDLQRYKNLKNTDAITKQQIEQLELKTKASKTSMDLAQRRMTESVIKASVSGNVNQVFVTQGGMIGQGKPVCDIIGDEGTVVKTGVQEELLKLLTPGMKVQLTDFSIPYETNAYIKSIGVVPDFMGKVPVEIAFEPIELLYAGRVLDIVIKVDLGEQLVIPVEAIAEIDGKAVVFILENQIASSVRVIPRQKINEFVIPENESDFLGLDIVMDGNHLLTSGDSVSIINKVR